MNKNKMLSLAAAMVLTTTSAMAFDALTTGQIVTNSSIIENGFIKANYNPNFETATTRVASGYNAAVEANANLALSTSDFGDALIYSAFRTGDGWESEITVTNTSTTDAVVAKVVLYAADDSRELIDFNIYLSANDVFTFKVDSTGVTTIDDSIEALATRAQEVSADSDADSVTMNTYGTLRQITSALPVTQGYAVIYAMAEATPMARTKAVGANTITTSAYHKDHGDLFLDYREMLDTCRLGAFAGTDASTNNAAWRQALISNTNMMNGMIRLNIQAPNVDPTCDDVDSSTSSIGVNYKNDTNFVDPSANILFGSAKITNTASGSDVDSRDILLPATALANYTAGNMSVWTAGEMATISDRRIQTGAVYNIAGVAADATTFEVASTFYSYSDNDMANTLHVTSPVKRPLVQLLGGASYWSGVAATKPYGEYDFTRTIYNDQEDQYTVASTINTGVIVSPYNPDAVVTEDAILIESGGLSNLQGPAVTANPTAYTKGYVQVNFVKAGVTQNYPAIVTQMSAKTVNGKPHTNWIYAPVK